MTLDCEHGQLARSCEICQLVRERDEARAAKASAEALLAQSIDVLRVQVEQTTAARRECERLQRQVEHLQDVDYYMAEPTAVEQERDEARAEAETFRRILRDWVDAFDFDNGPNLREDDCFERARAALAKGAGE